MPIYEYRCPKCGDFEAMQKMSDKPLGRCPTCGRKVVKLMSSTSFQLKGSGWYITDYARKGDVGTREKATDKSGDTGSDKSGDKASGKASDTAGATTNAGTTAASKGADKPGGGKAPGSGGGTKAATA